MKKIFIKTLGCEKNTVDSECAAGILKENGFRVVDDPKTADFLMVNTCGFINDAKVQSIESIFELVNEKTENQKIIVSGCLSKRYSRELSEEIPEVDYFLGVNDYNKLPDIISGKAMRVNCAEADESFTELPRSCKKGSVTASIKIAEGCNNICSYCIIPYIRGRYRSRKPEDILREAKILAECGVKELVIIAQDTTFYGKDFKKKDMLIDLLHELCKIDGIKWLRLMYCYENEITPKLIETIRNEDKIVKYIDIPIQHCSNKILKAMNRKSTHESIEKTIKLLRKQIPDIVIRTTLITGFPGETKEDFNELCDFVSEMKFDRLGVFPYSKEEGTGAAKMKPQVREDVKQRRCDKIMQLQQQISLENNRKYVGQTLDVLVEEDFKNGSYSGRSAYDAEGIDNSVLFFTDKKLKIGQFVKVLIDDAFDYDLSGKVVK